VRIVCLHAAKRSRVQRHIDHFAAARLHAGHRPARCIESPLGNAAAELARVSAHKLTLAYNNISNLLPLLVISFLSPFARANSKTIFQFDEAFPLAVCKPL
jgi:hypothetical protein